MLQLLPNEPHTLAAKYSNYKTAFGEQTSSTPHSASPVRHLASQPASHQLVRLFSGSLVGISELHAVSNSQTAAAHTLKC